MKRLDFLVYLLLMVFSFPLMGQNGANLDKYWIFLTDKGDVSHYSAKDILSERALERRDKHKITLHHTDYPVSTVYLDQISSAGATLRHPSKWFNAVSAWMDASTLEKVKELGCVKEVRQIDRLILDMDPVPENFTQNHKVGYNAGVTAKQLEMIGLDQLHQNGYNGTGVLIAVMDNGFRDVDENPYLQHIINDERLVATYDFVNDEEDVFDQGSHGAWVLSILAGWQEEAVDSFNFYGSAHGASYILCHTENDASETTQEEDNWVAAMEFADSIGADIFTTSLGYRGMDILSESYFYEDMDGNTTIITNGADLAASKGIIVVNSAGNSGSDHITAPADGDSVIAVGAVKGNREIAGFSSHGPTADGRIKPDVCAMGQNNAFVGTDGGLRRGNGTSFSCPVMSGFIACLLQARPETRNMEMYDALIRASDRYEDPDTVYGYGIPWANDVIIELGGSPLVGAPGEDELANGAIVFPNPASDRINVVYDNDAIGFDGHLQIFDVLGKKVLDLDVRVDPFYNVFHLEEELSGFLPGKYIVRLSRDNFKEPLLSQLIILHR